MAEQKSKLQSAKNGALRTTKTVAALTEMVGRFVAAYLILNNFTHVIAVAVGVYMAVTASGILVAVVHKAFKK